MTDSMTDCWFGAGMTLRDENDGWCAMYDVSTYILYRIHRISS